MSKLNLNRITLVAIAGANLDGNIRALNICKHYCDFENVILFTNFETDNEHKIETQPMDYNQYNTFIVKEIYKYITSDFMLFIHPDGFILNPNAWNDAWYNYDYIGAPWWYNDDFNVGNGGFTMRSKKLLDLLGTDENIKPINNGTFTPEDDTICRKYGPYLKSKGILFAPEHLAKTFSKEGNPKQGSVWNGEFGYHGNHVTNISKWSCPI